HFNLPQRFMRRVWRAAQWITDWCQGGHPMTTATLTLNKGFLSRHNWFDWLFAATVVAGGLFAFSRYGAYMDVYEKGILLAVMPAMIWLGWFWRPLRVLLLAVAGFALL